MSYWLELLALALLHLVVLSMAFTRLPRAAQHAPGCAASRPVRQILAAIEAEQRREAAAAGRHRLLSR